MNIKKAIMIVTLILLTFFVREGYCDGGENHSVFTKLLSTHVQEGEVDYKNLCQDNSLDVYIKQLSTTDPESLPTRAEKLAFWLNAYNAYTLKIICDNYPLNSINELHTGGLIFGSVIRQTVWHKKLVTINNELTSLDHIEHKIIRPIFKEPRIHFAIVCAAKGCPPLRNEAYEADRLDKQLTDQAEIFLSQKDKNNFDIKTRNARISPLFSWFKKDFISESGGVLEYLTPFLNEEISASIKNDPKSWKIKYTEYDWSLNEQ